MVRVRDMQKRQFAYAEGIERIRHHLLKEDNIYLANEFTVGYRLVPPGEQTSVAMTKGLNAIAREVVRMADAVTHIKMEELTEQQRLENAEAKIKIAAISGLGRNRLMMPFAET
jgi:hypothetical protein